MTREELLAELGALSAVILAHVAELDALDLSNHLDAQGHKYTAMGRLSQAAGALDDAAHSISTVKDGEW